MPTSPPFPTIPVPSEDLKSLTTSVLALKQVVEMLTGQGEFKDRTAAHVFVQIEPPEAIHEGDLWFCTGINYSLSIWNGQRWLLLANLPAAATTMAEPSMELALRQFTTRQHR